LRPILESLEARILLAHPCFVAFVDQEPNDTLERANAVFLDNCDVSHGNPVLSALIEGHIQTTSDHSKDIDFFTFWTEAERQIRLTFDGDAAQAGVLPQLLDAGGTVLAAAAGQDTDGDGTPDSATLDYFTAAGGQFFVQVGPGQNTNGPSHDNSTEFFPSVNISTGDVYIADFGASPFRDPPPTGFNPGWYETQQGEPTFAEWNPDDRQANITLSNDNLTAETAFSTSGLNNFQPYGAGDVIGVAVDLDNNRAYFSKNGVWQGDAQPNLLSGGLEMGMTPQFPEFFPTINISTGDVYTGNFGASPFQHEPPAGFNSGWYETQHDGKTFAEWNPADRQANISLSDHNLTAQTAFPPDYLNPNSLNDSVRATIGKTGGKWYFEILVAARSNSGDNYNSIGTATRALWLEVSPGDLDNGCGYRASGYVQCKLGAITTTLPPGNPDPHSDNDSVRATIGKTEGKWYFEILVAARSYSGYNAIGTATKALWLEVTPGADDNGCGYQASGYVQCKLRSITTTFESYGAGDVIGVAVDLDNNRAYFSKNGVWQGGADPNTLSGGLEMGMAPGFLDPAHLPYTLSVEVAPDPHHEHEPNDTLETANRIELQSPFWWPCDFVCPLADASGDVGQPAETASPANDLNAEIELRPIRWPGDRTLTGFIEGRVEEAACPSQFVCLQNFRPGVDNFLFDIPGDQEFSVHLTGPLVQAGGVLKLLDANGNVLTSDEDGSDGLGLERRTHEGDTFFVQLTSTLGVVTNFSCDDTLLTPALCASPWNYRLDVTSKQIMNPIEGPDEQEPNDTLAIANRIDLVTVGRANGACEISGVDGSQLPRCESPPIVIEDCPSPSPHHAYFSGVQDEPELAVIGVYETRNDHSGADYHPTGEAIVQVDRAGPLVLVLSSYEPTHWTVVAAPDTQIDAIYLIGFHHQSADAPVGIPVTAYTVADGNVLDDSRGQPVVTAVAWPRDFGGGNTPGLVEVAQRLSGLALTSFAGCYRATEFTLPVPPISERFGEVRGIAGGANKDQDVWSFDVRANEHFRVEFGEPYPFPSQRDFGASPLQIVVYDDAGNEIGRGGDRLIEFDATAEGTYFALVSPTLDVTDGALQHYTLQVNTAPSGSPPSGVEGPDEHEPNDTLDQANELALEDLPIGACSIELRAGDIQGIAGGPTGDQDFFQFAIQAGDHVNVSLGHGVLDGRGVLQVGPVEVVVYDWEGNELGRTSLLTGLEPVEFDAAADSVYFARVAVNADVAAAYPGLDATALASYRLELLARRAAVPVTSEIEGPDEHEPNDTFDEANPIELLSLPTFAPGIELRGGGAGGIAGGPTLDQDVFSFVVQAGEHVTVDVQGLLFDYGTGIARPIEHWRAANRPHQFDGELGTRDAEDTPLVDDATDENIDRITHILRRHPDLSFGAVDVVVFDANGNEVGRNSSTDASAVSLDAAEDGNYYAVVSVTSDVPGDRPVHYRLGVLARRSFDPELLPDPSDAGHGNGNVEPEVIVLGAGRTFRYTDSSGDQVQIVFRGRGGNATITFTGSTADGSDIASVEIASVRRGGSLSIQSSGDAEVGSIEIHAAAVPGARRRGGSNNSGFGTIRVDGNVGMVSSDINIRSLVVDGVLGEIYAPRRQITELRAGTFDAALSSVGSILSLRVEEDVAGRMFSRYLPLDAPPA